MRGTDVQTQRAQRWGKRELEMHDSRREKVQAGGERRKSKKKVGV